jgi:hypothetical protein
VGFFDRLYAVVHPVNVGPLHYTRQCAVSAPASAGMLAWAQDAGTSGWHSYQDFGWSCRFA